MITIQTNISDVADFFQRAGRELPFSMSKALTKTAQDVQEKVIRDLPEKFTLRRNWYEKGMRYGFKIRMANKTTLSSEVFTAAPWMRLHETGGIKTAPGKRLAVPFEEKQGSRPGVVFGVKRSKKDLIPKSQTPSGLGGKAFKIKGSKGDLLAIRTGRGKRSVLRIMYGLEPKANIKKRLQFAETAQQVVAQVWRKNFEEAIDYALRTARK